MAEKIIAEYRDEMHHVQLVNHDNGWQVRGVSAKGAWKGAKLPPSYDGRDREKATELFIYKVGKIVEFWKGHFEHSKSLKEEAHG